MKKNKLKIIKNALIETMSDIISNEEVSNILIVIFLFLCAMVPCFSIIMLLISILTLRETISNKNDIPPLLCIFFIIESIIMSIFSVFYILSIPVFGSEIVILYPMEKLPYIVLSLFSVLFSLIFTIFLYGTYSLVKTFLYNLKKCEIEEEDNNN